MNLQEDHFACYDLGLDSANFPDCIWDCYVLVWSDLGVEARYFSDPLDAIQ